MHGLFCSTYRQVLAEIKKHFKINFPDRIIYYNIYYVGQMFWGGLLCGDGKGPEQYRDTAPALFGLHYFKYFFSFRATSCMSMGFARWSSMPHSRHLWMSSEKASAVMAMMGTPASARSSFRMAAVAA